MRSDKWYMQRCEELGRNAASGGNAPVGAVIVRKGEIVSEAEEAGVTKGDITCHAEIEAVRMAVKKLDTKDLSDCILFTTHEPCIMCSYAIRYYKIKRVVFNHTVDYLGGVSSSMPVLLSLEVPPHWGKPPIITHLK